MSQNPLLACPPQLRAVQHYLKLAVDYENREPVITYWARLYSLQSALKIDKKSPEARTLLAHLMDWLENFKKSNLENESITSDVAGQAVLENEANKLFTWADSNDRAAVFNKNVVKSFYTVGVVLDVCEVFGDLNEEEVAQRKYAKWKATYIHNCLKSGETPIPGPIGGDSSTEGGDISVDVPQPPAAGVSGSYDQHQPGYTLPSVPHQPYQAPGMTPVEASSPRPAAENTASDASSISPVDLKQARKLCKWADSALDYQDVSTAIENLDKALALLRPHV